VDLDCFTGNNVVNQTGKETIQQGRLLQKWCPPLKKGGPGGFEVSWWYKIPLNPPFSKGEENPAHFATDSKVVYRLLEKINHPINGGFLIY
jgi:hypothetical protein